MPVRFTRGGANSETAPRATTTDSNHFPSRSRASNGSFGRKCRRQARSRGYRSPPCEDDLSGCSTCCLLILNEKKRIKRKSLKRLAQKEKSEKKFENNFDFSFPRHPFTQEPSLNFS